MMTYLYLILFSYFVLFKFMIVRVECLNQSLEYCQYIIQSSQLQNFYYLEVLLMTNESYLPSFSFSPSYASVGYFLFQILVLFSNFLTHKFTETLLLIFQVELIPTSTNFLFQNHHTKRKTSLSILHTLIQHCF